VSASTIARPQRLPTIVVERALRPPRVRARTGRPARRTRDLLCSDAPEDDDVTDQERQKAEELVSRLELSIGQIFPRDGGNAALLTTMIQTLNALRSLLGIVRPH
jgi:hypothetical protein